MTALCPRCGGNNISNDMCILCGTYIAPVERRVFVRLGPENACLAASSDAWDKFLQRKAEREAAYNARKEKEARQPWRNQPWYLSRFTDPERREKYLARQRAYNRKRRQEEKAAKWAEEVACVTGV